MTLKLTPKSIERIITEVEIAKEKRIAYDLFKSAIADNDKRNSDLFLACFGEAASINLEEVLELYEKQILKRKESGGVSFNDYLMQIVKAEGVDYNKLLKYIEERITDDLWFTCSFPILPVLFLLYNVESKDRVYALLKYFIKKDIESLDCDKGQKDNLINKLDSLILKPKKLRETTKVIKPAHVMSFSVLETEHWYMKDFEKKPVQPFIFNIFEGLLQTYDFDVSILYDYLLASLNSCDKYQIEKWTKFVSRLGKIPNIDHDRLFSLYDEFAKKDGVEQQTLSCLFKLVKNTPPTVKQKKVRKNELKNRLNKLLNKNNCYHPNFVLTKILPRINLIEGFDENFIYSTIKRALGIENSRSAATEALGDRRIIKYLELKDILDLLYVACSSNNFETRDIGFSSLSKVVRIKKSKTREIFGFYNRYFSTRKTEAQQSCALSSLAETVSVTGKGVERLYDYFDKFFKEDREESGRYYEYKETKYLARLGYVTSLDFAKLITYFEKRLFGNHNVFRHLCELVNGRKELYAKMYDLFEKYFGERDYPVDGFFKSKDAFALQGLARLKGIDENKFFYFFDDIYKHKDHEVKGHAITAFVEFVKHNGITSERVYYYLDEFFSSKIKEVREKISFGLEDFSKNKNFRTDKIIEYINSCFESEDQLVSNSAFKALRNLAKLDKRKFIYYISEVVFSGRKLSSYSIYDVEIAQVLFRLHNYKGFINDKVHEFITKYLSKYPLSEDHHNSEQKVIADLISKIVTPHNLNYNRMIDLVDTCNSLDEIIECSKIEFGEYKVIRRLSDKGKTARTYFVTHARFPNFKGVLKIYNEGVNENEYSRNNDILMLEERSRRHLVDIIPITDVQVNGVIKKCLFMRYAGKDLSTIIKERGTINDSTAINYFHQIIMGISCIYNDLNKAVHGDIHPRNIFINELNLVKIGDFGFSISQDKFDRRHNRGYGPPINYNGESVDVFAAGLVLYEMVTGKHLIFEKSKDFTSQDFMNLVKEKKTQFYNKQGNINMLYRRKIDKLSLSIRRILYDALDINGSIEKSMTSVKIT